MSVAGQAETTARLITDPGQQAYAVARVAEALAAAGQYQQAEATARLITDPGRQADALARVAETLAAAGQQKQAVSVAGQAETTARLIIDRASKRTP